MSKQETAQQLRKVANFMKGLIQAADDIEAIGSMEGATKEAAQARDTALAERDQALAELADAKAKAEEVVKKATYVAEKLADDTLRTMEVWKAEAWALVDKTTNDLISKAERQAAEMTDKAAASVQAAGQDLANLAVKKGELMAEVTDLEGKAKAAQAEHEKLTKALDALKAKFKIGE